MQKRRFETTGYFPLERGVTYYLEATGGSWLMPNYDQAELQKVFQLEWEAQKTPLTTWEWRTVAFLEPGDLLGDCKSFNEYTYDSQHYGRLDTLIANLSQLRDELQGAPSFVRCLESGGHDGYPYSIDVQAFQEEEVPKSSAFFVYQDEVLHTAWYLLGGVRCGEISLPDLKEQQQPPNWKGIDNPVGELLALLKAGVVIPKWVREAAWDAKRKRDKR